MKFKKRFIWLLISTMMVLSLVLASCGEAEEEEEVIPPGEEEEVVIPPGEEEEVTPPTGGDWWDKYGEPQYGGTMILRMTADVNQPYDSYYAQWGYSIYGSDSLFQYDYTISEEDYDIYRQLSAFDSPTTVGAKVLPWLALSFEQNDPITWTVKLRQGVHWHDKPPVNGREFTASDVEYHWNRLMGLGKYGFTERSPYCLVTTYVNIASVEAVDKYTVVYKFKEEALGNRDAIIAQGNVIHHYVCPKEAIDLWGTIPDWQSVVTTGAWIITDYVSGSAITYERNSNYYLYDARHPENQLPYPDTLKQLIIPDASTAIAALRSGKIDILAGLTWHQADSLKKTNPELEQDMALGSGTALNFRCDREPFSDIRVRKAMQMAIDLKGIADTYYGGNVDGTPIGFHTPYATEFIVPYEEWPQSLKDEYAYNPEGAKALLAEAGYPDGFKTSIVLPTSADLDLLQIIKAFMLDIGIDMELETYDAVTATAIVTAAGDADSMNNKSGFTACNWPWQHIYARNMPGGPMNYSSTNDLEFEKLYNSAIVASTAEELQEISREMCLYDLQKHYRIYLQPVPSVTVYQPYFKGFSGEVTQGWSAEFPPLLHWWIDQDIKKEMGLTSD